MEPLKNSLCSVMKKEKSVNSFELSVFKIGLKPGHLSKCSIMNNTYVKDDS